MKLIRLDKWRDVYFVEPRPSLADLQRNCRAGKIPADKVGKFWYVRVHGDNNLALVHVTTTSTGNALVDRVLAATP